MQREVGVKSFMRGQGNSQKNTSSDKKEDFSPKTHENGVPIKSFLSGHSHSCFSTSLLDNAKFVLWRF